MAELLPPDPGRCSYFFLYDGSKVRGEGDPTREGICYFYPEETPLDEQELLCGQLAGVGRCVSELSSSTVRTIRLHRRNFAIRMKDDFFWALGFSADVPTVSACQLLDRLINVFCFYNGSVRQSYQSNTRETLAAQWARYLSQLQSGPSPLCCIFSCLKTIDLTDVDPLLLLKAALILQACQRCPLVSAGCILFRGRVVSTQMPPELTMKVMVHESETYTTAQRSGGPNPSSSFGSTVSSTAVFLTTSELRYLQSPAVDKDHRSHSAPHKDGPPKRTRLSRTLSDTPSTESEPVSPNFLPQAAHRLFHTLPFPASDDSPFGPAPPHGDTESSVSSPWSPRPPVSCRTNSHETDGDTPEESHCHNGDGDKSVLGEKSLLNGGDGDASLSGDEQTRGDKMLAGDSDVCCRSARGQMADPRHPPPVSAAVDNLDGPLTPMTLYVHRVNGLVLALLVEPHFMSDSASVEEVYHCSLASLNGLEAHLQAIAPGPPHAPGPYIFAHFDCMQSTLTTNVSGRPGGAPEHPFVRATSLLHSHFCNTETLQEAIIRSAGAAVYGNRSLAQETYFQQQGGSLRNSGIPNHQDSAFSLPSKARHRLLKHGVNLL